MTSKGQPPIQGWVRLHVFNHNTFPLQYCWSKQQGPGANPSVVLAARGAQGTSQSGKPATSTPVLDDLEGDICRVL